MTTTKMAFAMIVGLALTGCDPRAWYGHGHEPGHSDDGCKKGKHHGCEDECPSASHFRTEAGACLRKALIVSAGDQYTCAVLSGGDVKCWGYNNSWDALGYGPGGNRGDEPGEMGDALPAEAIGDGLSATDVYAADDAMCALIEGGRLKCWGYNGHGLVTGIVDEVALPPSAATLRMFGSEAVQVATGDGYAVTLHADGTLSYIGPGVSLFPLDEAVVVQFARNDDVSFDLCAVTDDGNVLGYSGGSLFPVDLGMGHTASQVAVGVLHSCALLDDGGVKCWGMSNYGQSGQGDMEERDPHFNPGVVSPLAPIALGQPATAIAAGHFHTCAILLDGSVKCWGRNNAGQLGIGTTDDMGDEPADMAALQSVDLGTGRTAVAIDAGTHTCALLDNGGIKCWGPNGGGGLGQGDTAARGDAPGELGDALPEIDLGS